MGHVLGFGGFFLRARDPGSLARWYAEQLGVGAGEHGQWDQPAGPAVFATFPLDADDPAPVGQQAVLNLRVHDLAGLLADLRAAGAAVEDATQDLPGVGRFGWVRDPEGNRVELWEPAG